MVLLKALEGLQLAAWPLWKVISGGEDLGPAWLRNVDAEPFPPWHSKQPPCPPPPVDQVLLAEGRFHSRQASARGRTGRCLSTRSG